MNRSDSAPEAGRDTVDRRAGRDDALDGLPAPLQRGPGPGGQAHPPVGLGHRMEVVLGQ